MSTQYSHTVVLSAYVRTLLFAKVNFPDFQKYIERFNLEVIPLGKEYSKLLHSLPPEGWPKLEELNRSSGLPTQDDLRKILKELSHSSKIILQASAPVSRDYLNVSIDLEVLCVEIPNNITLTAQEIIEGKTINIDSEIECNYLAEQLFPEGLNRWEIDYFLRGVFNPRFLIGAGDPAMEYKESSINYLEGDICNSSFIYWLHEWYPAYKPELGSCLGTALLASEKVTDVLKTGSNDDLYLVGKFTIIDKSRNYSSNAKISSIYEMLKI